MSKIEPAALSTRPSGQLTGGAKAVLAGLFTLSVFASDLYLASLPAIGRDLDAPPWAVQLTLTGYLLVLGVGQLLAGPITDTLGRKRPLLVGMGVFVAGSVVACVAPNVLVLVLARLLQGVGGAMSVVVCNSVVRDSARGAAATRLYALLMTIGGVAPVVAPSLGGVIEANFGWRVVFGTLVGMGILAFAATSGFLPETLSPQDRVPLRMASVMKGYAALLQQPAFTWPLLAIGLMFVMLFGYIGGAPYAYQGHYGLGPAAFGAVIGATGAAASVGPLIGHRLSHHLSGRSQAILGAAVCLVGALFAAWAIAANQPLVVVVVILVSCLIGLGVCDPPLFSSAMSSVDHSVGSASALIGATQFLLAAGATAVAGPLAAASAVGWVLFMAVAAFAGLLCATRIGIDKEESAVSD